MTEAQRANLTRIAREMREEAAGMNPGSAARLGIESTADAIEAALGDSKALDLLRAAHILSICMSSGRHYEDVEQDIDALLAEARQ